MDASAHWGSARGPSLDDLTLMAGPGVRFGKRGGTVFFVRALAGLVRDRASIAVLDVDISESSSRFGVLAGGGIDVPHREEAGPARPGRLPVERRRARIASGSDSGEVSRSSGFRASAGVVYRFGIAP